jgi:hypothetical protein
VKQCINPVIRAHLVRGAFHLILLIAVCVIPFALGQRATTKQSAVADPLLSESRAVATLSTGSGPASGSWTVTGSLNAIRAYHRAILLSNGMVLVAGGVRGVDTLASAELYYPAIGTWTATGNLNTARWFHTATLLPNGMVLVAAGESSKSNASFPVDPDRARSWSLGVPRFIFPVASAELYTPAATPTPIPTPTPCEGRCSPTPRPHSTPRPRPTPPPRP